MGLFQATGQLIVKISLEKTLSYLEEAQNVKRVHFMTCQQAVCITFKTIRPTY